jgi:hypothetical protein
MMIRRAVTWDVKNYLELRAAAMFILKMVPVDFSEELITWCH